MEYVWIKFLKDYEDHKKDSIVKVEKVVGDSLIALKFAEVTEAPEDSLIKDVVKELGESLAVMVKTGISEGINTLNTEIKTKIPAIPIDHKEKGQRGFKNSTEFFHSVVRACAPTGRQIDERLAKLWGEDDDEGKKGTPSGMGTRDDVSAGFLVPETWAGEIWEFIIAQNEILPKTDQRQTTSNNLNINGMEETSRKDSYRDGGMLSYWMAEADQYTSSQPRFTRRRLELHKLGVLAYVTEEELSDSGTSLGPILTRKAARAINFKVNESFIWGSGVGKPFGAMLSDCLITANLAVNQPNNSILHQNINHMYALMRPELRAGAQWYVHPNLQEQLEYIAFNDSGVVNSNTYQIPIYMPPGGLTASPYGTLKGLPVVPCEFMKDFGYFGDILLANWSQYVTLTKVGGGISSAMSLHVRFLYDEQAFKWTFRIDGQPMWSAPLEDYNGTTKRSPFVTLKSRYTVSSSSGL